ncbi:glycosyltransferase family 4 protein [Paenibacillus sp. D2_2]|uniref:glycosyltransferase family 4 protein n=1 Tax=Paenibacillus sp. D2_2 TaxID=3073092 RepID=UPI002815B1E7|nr:glycosyltransferase family 4 protein [Paenibacillus sp. D2_2]WMT43448.1 glycosyltransferase family 4 protein [Paenibacillus sp. D2_2]
MPVKVAFVASIYRHFVDFHLPYMNLLQKKGCEVHAYAQPGEERKWLEQKGVVCHDVPIQRSPLQIQNFKALQALTRSFRTEGFRLVHVHTPVASILGRIAARRAGVPKTLYTAHGFHFFTGAPLLNWLLYYPIERLMARFTDILITINDEDFQRALKFPVRSKVTYVPGVGIDLELYGSREKNPVNTTEKNITRNQLFNLPESKGEESIFVVLCVAELNANKNQKQLIEALSQLGDRAGNIHLALAGTGPSVRALLELADRLGVQDRVHMLGYRRDIPELLNKCDAVALVSYREGLPRAIMEAMAAGKPVIGTNIRGIRDLIADGTTGILIPVDDVAVTSKALYLLRDDPALVEAMGKAGKERIISYSLPAVLQEMDTIYTEALKGSASQVLPTTVHTAVSGER